MWKVTVVLILCSLGALCENQHEDENSKGYFFPGFPFPPGVNFPQDFFPRLPNLRPPSNNRPRPRPDNNRERCPSSGIKFISHPRNCEKYILCIEGEEVTELTCNDGLHFSRITRTCVDPRAAGCERFEWVCPEEDIPGNMVFLPNKQDCSAYFLCWQGTPVPMTCPGGQHWSIFENSCMNPADANCQFSSRTSRTFTNQNEQTKSMEVRVSTKSYGTCPPTGIVSIPNPNSCEEFYLCIHGLQIEQQCRPGLHFSPTLGNCAPPEIANCVVSRCPPTGLEFLPHEEDCNLYFICFNGIKTEMTCPNNLHWSPTENRCMEPSEAGCEDGHKECPSTGIVQIPNPEDCERFILCLNGMEIPLSCAPGLHFSPTTRQCMSPEDAECEEVNQWRCPERDTPGVIVFIPNTEDCSMYYLCWGGTQIPLSCPSGDHWSITNNRCMPAHLADCPWADDDDVETCPDEGIKAIEHPESCERYILCVNGHEVERECGHGLHFSRELRNCVHPIIADCRLPRAFELPTNGTCPQFTSPHDFTFIPNIEDCNSYYLCLKNKSKLFNCAKGLHFDIKIGKCMQEEKAKCIKE